MIESLGTRGCCDRLHRRCSAVDEFLEAFAKFLLLFDRSFQDFRNWAVFRNVDMDGFTSHFRINIQKTDRPGKRSLFYLHRLNSAAYWLLIGVVMAKLSRLMRIWYILQQQRLNALRRKPAVITGDIRRATFGDRQAFWHPKNLPNVLENTGFLSCLQLVTGNRYIFNSSLNFGVSGERPHRASPASIQ